MTYEHPERRGRSVALIGLIFQTLMFASLSLLTVWSQAQSLQALSGLALLGLPIWLVLVLIYHQRVLVEAETFESEQLRKERQAGLVTEAVFDVDDEQLLLARRRLRWMYRWVLPVFSIVVIAGLAFFSLIMWNWSLGSGLSEISWPTLLHADVLVWVLGAIGFLSFLLSRYAVGMARQREWQMLRAGASYLMGMALGSVAVAACLGAMELSDPAAPWTTPEHVLTYVLRLLMLALAVEFALNLVLDFYRPRGPEEIPRPAFDSRLLGLFTEPGGIARSIAEAINYQFGFEVSSTWFYKLMERSAVPLVGFCVACMLAASCFVFIGQEERGIIERFGTFSGQELSPGLHLKYPWPIDAIYKVSIERIHEFKIGIQADRQDTEESRRDKLILWTNQHSQEPHMTVLVATPKLAEFMTGEGPEKTGETLVATQEQANREQLGSMGEGGEAVSVSQLRVSLTVEYKIRQAYPWITTYRDPEWLAKAIATREVTQYFASVDVGGVLGTERGPIEAALWKTIQKATDDANLGLEIVFLGLQGVHPPQEAAEAFQEVIGAEQKKMVTVRSARSDYNKRLAEVAGDVRRAEQLDQAIKDVSRLSADANVAPNDIETAKRQLDTLFFGDQSQNIRPAGGEAIIRIAEARSERWRLENAAHAKAVAFEQEIATKNVAPRVYKAKRYLSAVANSVAKIRKYVNATQHQGSSDTFHLDIKDPMGAPLDTALEGEE